MVISEFIDCTCPDTQKHVWPLMAKENQELQLPVLVRKNFSLHLHCDASIALLSNAMQVLTTTSHLLSRNLSSLILLVVFFSKSGFIRSFICLPLCYVRVFNFQIRSNCLFNSLWLILRYVSEFLGDPKFFWVLVPN